MRGSIVFIRLVFIALLLLSIPCLIRAQDCLDSENKKAGKFYSDAEESYRRRQYTEAMKSVGKAIEEDPEYAGAYLLQGNIALKKKDFNEMESSFRKVEELCPEAEPDIYFQLGWLYFDMKKWSEAEKAFNRFLSFDRINEDHGTRAERMLAKSRLYASPVPFTPVPVKDISTADPEYLPYISPDNELAFFTRRFDMKDKNMLTPQSVEKFMIARLQPDGLYDSGRPMEDPFNRGSSNNEGGATITIDNKQLFFTVNSKGNFDICTSMWTDGKWGPIENLGPAVNDPKQWDAQPSISSDGKTLYFATARDSSSGIDIYKSVRKADGTWSKAVSLGPQINTNGNEKSPFMHSDSKTLYFSSDSLPGLGGFDIFKCKMDENGNWSTPVNLGYPINTEADEVGFFVSTNGRTGYYASNRINGNTGYDIYSFDLYPEARPERVYFQKGDLNGEEDEEAVAVTIEVKDAITEKITKIDVDSVTGEYAFVVSFENDLIMSIKKEGYAFESRYIASQDTQNDKPQRVDIELQKLEVGGQYTLNDILFATNSYQLNDTIKTVLDEFVDYLKRNPGLRVSLHGHTDNVGNPQDNMVLSENRAREVFNYLTSRSIGKERITYKGFGETKPIADNSTAEGRAKNRRTVFVVTSNN